ncbi:gas vesicle protein K [Patescibacteria group bacterium]|nr:gas vesicle protein K [Patescibacteria group bacterium]
MNQIVKNQHFTILELLDRLLDKGVVVKGEILLSVADIDLVYLNLGLLLSSVKTVEKAARKGSNGKATLVSWETSTQGEFLNEPQIELGKEVRESKDGNGKVAVRALPSVIDHGMEEIFRPKANIDPKNVERGLAKLVLTLVDLIRKLMEKQAVRRVEDGFLTGGEIERMGNAFLLLDERMEQLKETFGLKDEDLSLDLGPLGELI